MKFRKWKGLPFDMLRFFFVLLGLAAAAFGQTPRIFFTDLESGPNTGGENNNGVFVTIYGTNFGSSRGSSTVTVGGAEVAGYKLWGTRHLWYQKITVQIGPNARTGQIVVRTGNGTSNGVPFTVRAGNIYFVATNGNDSNNGSFTSPWRSVTKGANSIQAGDTVYVMNGVSQTATQSYASTLPVGDSGRAGAPLALIAYPGATVTIGTLNVAFGLRTPAISGGPFSYWTVAGMTIRGTTAIDTKGVTGWRIIGNDLSCPNGGGPTACLHTTDTTNSQVFGNIDHDSGGGAESDMKLFHRFYFSTNSNNLDIGWNEIYGGKANRGIQFYSTGGSAQYGLSVHDNYIHDVRGDGINFATVDAGRGKVEAYNNLIVNAGTGPDPGDISNYACVLVNGSSSGAVQLYNNTFYGCGARGGSNAGLLAAYIPTVLRNNIFFAVGQPYLTSSSSRESGNLSGSNNLWHGQGSGPSSTSGNINADPQVVNAGARDFHLKSTSPAKDAGANTGLAADRDGIVRPQGAAFDIGAYEFGDGAGPIYSDCDINRDGGTDQGDVLVAKNQVLGREACGGDLDQNGRCDVVDLQRVINAAMGGSCRVGQ